MLKILSIFLLYFKLIKLSLTFCWDKLIEEKIRYVNFLLTEIRESSIVYLSQYYISF